MQRFFPAAALIALVLCACGSREVPVARNGQPVTPATSAIPQTAVPTTVAVPTEIDQAIGQLRTQTTPNENAEKPGHGEGVDYGAMGPAPTNTMPLTVTLSASCATPGQTMQATATTLPSSKLAFVAAYSDNDFVPNFTYVPAEANPTGTFTWSWQITPNTPRGNAMVNVVASKEKKGASYKSPFRVADSC